MDLVDHAYLTGMLTCFVLVVCALAFRNSCLYHSRNATDRRYRDCCQQLRTVWQLSRRPLRDNSNRESLQKHIMTGTNGWPDSLDASQLQRVAAAAMLTVPAVHMLVEGSIRLVWTTRECTVVLRVPYDVNKSDMRVDYRERTAQEQADGSD